MATIALVSFLPGPACAAFASAGDTTVVDSPGGSAASREKLKVSFLKQMEADSTSSDGNLGLAYWIELNRQGHLYRTSNFAKFQSGDQIRFHVLPNTDGFVYIVMYKGSTGSKSVLFPPPDMGINNFVKKGSECVVPHEGSLEFDQVPGTEQVGLLLSKKKIDPVAYITSATAATSSATKVRAVAKAGVPIARSPVSNSANLSVQPVLQEATGEQSDLEKSFDAIFGSQAAAGGVSVRKPGAPGSVSATPNGIGRFAESENPGALEMLSVDHGMPVQEAATRVLSSPSTALVVNEDPNTVVLVDFGLKHD